MGAHKKLENDKELNINCKSAALPDDYAIRLQLARLKEVEENAERLALDNKKKRLDIEKTNCNLCYIAAAETEINKVLGPIANFIKNLDQILTTRLNLSGTQTAIVQDVVDDVLGQIAAIDIQLKSTEEIDAERAHVNAADKEKLMNAVARNKAATRKKS